MSEGASRVDFTVEIDCLATARRVLASPDGVFSLNPFEAVALAACTVRESTGEMPALPVVPTPPQGAAGKLFSASLAAHVAGAIRAWDALAKAEKAAQRSPVQDDGLADLEHAGRDAFADAMCLLTHQFEKEFPDGSR